MKHLLLAVFAIGLFGTFGFAAEPSGELSKKELKALLSGATTPQDHSRLARHYEAKARQYQAESAEHAELAKLYRMHPTVSEVKRPGAPDTAAHCEFLAQNLEKAAKEARALADSHAAMAKK